MNNIFQTYFVSVFGVGRDRRAGTLLAASNVSPRTSTAKQLRDNVSYKAEIKGGKLVFYYKVRFPSILILKKFFFEGNA